MKNNENPEVSSGRTVVTRQNQSSGTVPRLLTVLIVDDVEWVRHEMEILVCNPLNCRALAFESSEQALEVASHIDFDVVISDLYRPGVDDFDFLKAYKAAHPLTPVIVISGWGSGDNERRAIELGAFRCLQKPQRIETIIATVNDAIDYRESLSGCTGKLPLARLQHKWWREPGFERYMQF